MKKPLALVFGVIIILGLIWLFRQYISADPIPAVQIPMPSESAEELVAKKGITVLLDAVDESPVSGVAGIEDKNSQLIIQLSLNTPETNLLTAGIYTGTCTKVAELKYAIKTPKETLIAESHITSSLSELTTESSVIAVYENTRLVSCGAI